MERAEAESIEEYREDFLNRAEAGDYHALENLGLIAFAHERTEEALGHFRIAFHNLGELKQVLDFAEKISEEQPELAIQILGLAIAAGEMRAHIELARIHLEYGRFDKAKEEFERGRAVMDGADHRKLGELYFSAGDTENAIRAFGDAIQLGDKEAHYLLGRTLYSLGIREGTYEFFIRAITNDDPRGFWGLAKLSANRNEFGRAVSLCLAGLEQGADEITTYELAGAICKAGKFGRAAHQFLARVLKLNHHNEISEELLTDVEKLLKKEGKKLD